MLLGFLGRYSTKVAEVAANLPHSLYGYNHSLSDVIQSDTFEQRAVFQSELFEQPVQCPVHKEDRKQSNNPPDSDA